MSRRLPFAAHTVEQLERARSHIAADGPDVRVVAVVHSRRLLPDALEPDEQGST